MKFRKRKLANRPANRATTTSEASHRCDFDVGAAAPVGPELRASCSAPTVGAVFRNRPHCMCARGSRPSEGEEKESGMRSGSENRSQDFFRKTLPGFVYSVYSVGSVGSVGLPGFSFSAFPILHFSAFPLSRFPAFPLSRFSAFPLFRFSDFPNRRLLFCA